MSVEASPSIVILLWLPETGFKHSSTHPQLCRGAPGLDLPWVLDLHTSDANSMCLQLSSHPPKPALAVALTGKFPTQAKTLRFTLDSCKTSFHHLGPE